MIPVSVIETVSSQFDVWMFIITMANSSHSVCTILTSLCIHVCNWIGADDLEHVLRVLHDADLAAKWRAIGQTLTISDGDLDGFDTRFKGDPDLCLLQVVATWLRGQTRLQDRPSWRRVVWVIADPSGGDQPRAGYEVAKKLRGVCICVAVLSLAFDNDSSVTLYNWQGNIYALIIIIHRSWQTV